MILSVDWEFCRGNPPDGAVRSFSGLNGDIMSCLSVSLYCLPDVWKQNRRNIHVADFFVFGPVWATACCVSNLDLAPWTYLTSVSVNNSYRGLVSDFRNGNNEQNLAFLQLSILTLIFLLRTLQECFATF